MEFNATYRKMMLEADSNYELDMIKKIVKDVVGTKCKFTVTPDEDYANYTIQLQGKPEDIEEFLIEIEYKIIHQLNAITTDANKIKNGILTVGF